jgi:uncharacterized protein involved in outer membrane biogenesis
MRKLLIALAVALALLVIALLAVPPLFGGRILDAALEAANEQLEAEVRIEGASLSLVRSFPNPSVSLEGIVVSGRGPFAGQTLAEIERLRITVGLASVLGGQPELRELALIRPAFDLTVNPDGQASWDILPASDDTASDEPSSFSLDLRDIRVEGLDLDYDDQQARLAASIRGLDHRGDGSISGDVYRFDNHTEIQALTLRDGAMTWLKDARVQADLPVSYDGSSGAVGLGESRLVLNDLALGFSGTATPRGEDWDLDISYRAVDASFRSILSLVPGVYTAEFADVQTEGSLSLAGTVKGLLPAEGEDLPGFALEAQVRDASFRMPELPTGVDDIQLDLKLGHPGGDPDLIMLDLEQFRMAVAGSPVTGSLKLRQPMSDPDVQATAKGRVDLARLHQALPLEGVEYGGLLDLDVDVAGRMSDFEQDRLDRVRAAGAFALSDAVYRDEELPVPVAIATLAGSLGPRSTEIRQLSMTMGDSDLSGTGQLDDLIPWFFGDGTLGGRLSVASKRFDTNPWLEDDGEAEAADPDASSLVAVPSNLDLVVDADFERVLYGDLELLDLQGRTRLSGGAARVEDLDFTLLGGRVSMRGAYVAPTDQKADVELQLDMVDFELAELARSFETVRLLVPIAERVDGRFSTDLELQATLGSDLKPDLPTLASAGLLASRSLVLRPAFMEQVGNKLGDERYASIDLSKGELGFRIRNGRANFEEMDVKVGGAKGTLSGSTGVLDKTLDLVLDLEVPTRALKSSGLLEQFGIVSAGKVDLRVVVAGTYDQPKVAFGMPGLAESVRDVVEDRIQEQVEDLSSALVGEARAAGDKLVAEAEKKRDQLVAAAETQGERLKDEAKKQAQALVDKAAGNPLAEAAAKEAGKKLKQEARDAAKKLVNEAEAKGDALVEAAKNQRAELIARAEGS